MSCEYYFCRCFSLPTQLSNFDGAFPRPPPSSKFETLREDHLNQTTRAPGNSGLTTHNSEHSTIQRWLLSNSHRPPLPPRKSPRPFSTNSLRRSSSRKRHAMESSPTKIYANSSLLARKRGRSRQRNNPRRMKNATKSNMIHHDARAGSGRRSQTSVSPMSSARRNFQTENLCVRCILGKLAMESGGSVS